MKRFKSALFGGLIIGIGAFFFKANSSQYKTASKQVYYEVPYRRDDTIRIAYIGDSWAFLHSKHQCVIDSIVNERTGFQTKVRSTGVNGMTSKSIYESLFRNESFRSIIKWGPTYCFIVAGINDVDFKLGESFYVENMQLLIDFMLENKITPIILEIPHYDIINSYDKRNIRQKLSVLVSMIITSSSMDCIDSYRAFFERNLKKVSERIIYVKEQEWSPLGYNDPRGIYLEDKMHLNNKGYMILDSCIASHICKDIIMFYKR